jgi:hypothetical protein
MDVPSCKERLRFIEHGNLDKNSDVIEESATSNWNIKLKQHQRATIFAMRRLETSEYTLNFMNIKSSLGIISDSPGSGKTFDILGNITIQPILDTFPKTILQYGLKSIYVETSTQYKQFKETNLIIVPHALLSQWKKSIEKTSLTFTTIRTRKNIEDFNIDNLQIITLISSSMYMEFIQKNTDYIWSRIVFDEADTINIPKCPFVDSNFTWLVSSALDNILFPSGSYFVRLKLPHNRIITTRKLIEGVKKTGYIRDLLTSLEITDVNKFLPYFILKNNDAFIKNVLNLQEPNTNRVLCHEPLYLNILSNFVGKEILEHLNSGNINAAVEKLGATVDSKENIISTFTRTLQMKINNSKHQRTYIESLECFNDQDKETKRKRISIINQDIEEKENKMQTIISRCNSSCVCPICYDNPHTPTILNCCNSTYCMKCITNSLIVTNNTCPLCRKKIENIDMFIIGQSNNAKNRNLPTKYEALENIIRFKKGKFLIFSTNHNGFKELSSILKNNSIRSEYIIGSGQRIDNIIDEYKTKDLNVLLLNAQYYGTGLDLENTTDLIFMHKMSKDMEKQVIGRAQRQGRTCQLTIHYLLHNNETRI